MSVSARRRGATCLLRFDPLQSFCVEDSQVAVVLLAVIAPKHVQFAFVESCSVVLNLRSGSCAIATQKQVRTIHESLIQKGETDYLMRVDSLE